MTQKLNPRAASSGGGSVCETTAAIYPDIAWGKTPRCMWCVDILMCARSGTVQEVTQLNGGSVESEEPGATEAPLGPPGGVG